MSPVNKERNMKEDLLIAAIQLFANRGFHGTSIRDLIREADATLSSVNYYFGSKENLYHEAIRYALNEKIKIRSLFEKFNSSDLSTPQSTANALAALITQIADSIISKDSSNLNGIFISRAMLDSVPGTDEVFLEIQDEISKFEHHLSKIVSPDVEFNPILFTTFMLGQIQYLILTKGIILNRQGIDDFSKDFIQKAVQQITHNLLLPIGLPLPQTGQPNRHKTKNKSNRKP